MDVLRTKINESTLKCLEKLAASKGSTLSAIARELIEQALSRADLSASIASLGNRVEAMQSEIVEICAEGAATGRKLQEDVKRVNETMHTILTVAADVRYGLDGLGFRILEKQAYEDWKRERDEYHAKTEGKKVEGQKGGNT